MKRRLLPVGWWFPVAVAAVAFGVAPARFALRPAAPPHVESSAPRSVASAEPAAAVVEQIVPAPQPIAASRPASPDRRPYAGRDPASDAPEEIPYDCPDDGRDAAWDTRVIGLRFDASVADPHRARIRDALDAWAAHAPIAYADVAEPGAPRTIDASFGHADCPRAFDAADLAHAFKPAPIADEPLAGDVHFNGAWAWDVEVDLFTVALHETGHSLGLTHSENPAAVMYPFYRGPVEGLHPDDIAAIQALYGDAPSGAAVEAERYYNINGGVVGTCGASTPPAPPWSAIAILLLLLAARTSCKR
jgi:hypothetical protein